MIKKFYDEEEFQRAVDLLETNPYRCVELLEEYSKKYPTDYYGRIYYALSLTRICDFQRATEEYNTISNNAMNDEFYSNNQHKNIDGFKYYMLMVRIKILAWQEKYQEIFNIISKCYKELHNADYVYLSYYCRMKLGLLILNEDEVQKSTYRFRQAYNYKEELFRDHINKHLKEFNEENEQCAAIFADDFPIDRIIEEVKKRIPSDNKLFPGYFDDTYYFKYDYCGTVKNNEGINEWTNYFVVVCFHNTTNIITMCPAISRGKIPADDLTEIRYETAKPKTKALSQIDKFNKRFNRN